MFGFSGKNVPNFFFDLSKTKTINILGLLLIYKFLEYTVEHKCFKNPICNLRDINDISAGQMDEQMFPTIAKLGVPYIIMHMKGTPQDMQMSPQYDHFLKEIFYYFSEKVQKLRDLGVKDIIIDPGFGFGKTLEHNYELMNHLEEFNLFELPLLVGVSRKSMIYKLLGSTPEEALNGTTALHTIALLKGAHILRVHDVKEAVATETTNRLHLM